MSFEFPANFVWGVAAAAPQIEGAASEEGKGESIWDHFARIPGKIKNGDSPRVACDHFHRTKSDAALMQGLGVRHYRLSIAWPRVVPDGDGPVNARGLDFYDRLIDTLHAHDVTPWVTMFHWDLPQALENQGGWLNRATSVAFGRYAEAIVKRLSDRVANWFTVNEIPCFIGNGYGNGYFAPGRRVSRQSLNQAYHHALLAHGYGVEAIRAWGGPGTQVGLVHNHLPAPPIPVTETAANCAAARLLYERANGQLMGPVFQGRYPDAFLEEAGPDAPEIEPGDLKLIGQPTDFLGLNVYAGDFVREGANGAPEVLPFPQNYPTGALWWLKLTPESLYWAIRHAVEVYGVRGIYVTENGATFDDVVTSTGEIIDLDRREYLRSYLATVHRAVAEDYDVRGYFLWSLLDNFEWAEGYQKRFGIVHVDFETQIRTPKLSARWYSEVMRSGRLV